MFTTAHSYYKMCQSLTNIVTYHKSFWGWPTAWNLSHATYNMNTVKYGHYCLESN